MKIDRFKINTQHQPQFNGSVNNVNPTGEVKEVANANPLNSVDKKSIFETNLASLKKISADLQNLSSTSYVLDWDYEISMPKAAASGRSWQMGFLAKCTQKIINSKDLKNIIDYFGEEINYNQLNKIEKALLREVKKQYQREKNIPASLFKELSDNAFAAYEVWDKNEMSNVFNKLIPHIEKIFLIKRQMTERIGYVGSPYNTLIDEYEFNMTVEKLDTIFAKLKSELILILKKIEDSPVKIESDFLRKIYDHDKQLIFNKNIAEDIGFDFSRGLLDESNSLFSYGISPNDARVTTCIFEDNVIYTIGTTLHESGHGIYDLGFDPGLANTPLFDAASIGFHESQARFYETIIGQGLPFWKYYFPKLQKLFPEQLNDVTLEQFYKAINKVEVFSRWSASDELTYNIHIIVLYEIEKSLIEGKLKVQDITEFWKQKIQEHLGVNFNSDKAELALQNSYWTKGDLGYLPTYSLGNLYAAQIYNTIKKEIPDIEEQIANGNFITLREWFREKIHKYGKIETPSEVLKRVTGEELNPEHFINYIKEKYSKIYSIDL